MLPYSSCWCSLKYAIACYDLPAPVPGIHLAEMERGSWTAAIIAGSAPEAIPSQLPRAQTLAVIPLALPSSPCVSESLHGYILVDKELQKTPHLYLPVELGLAEKGTEDTQVSENWIHINDASQQICYCNIVIASSLDVISSGNVKCLRYIGTILDHFLILFPIFFQFLET